MIKLIYILIKKYFRRNFMTLVQLKYVITIATSGSFNEAAKKLFISQPSLSNAINSMEKEIGFSIFLRSQKGIILTAEGEEFIGYARQVVEQYNLLDAKYVEKTNVKKKFSVSMQHYTFAVDAFVEMVKHFGMEEYEFAVHETKTHEVIENVKNLKSEIGIIFLNTFNEKILSKILLENDLEFTRLLDCGVYVYLWKGHPLAKEAEIFLEELAEYPFLSFAQGDFNSFYYSEEVLSTYEFKRTIKTSDRATMLNLMIGLNGYTLCSGIMCEKLNGDDFSAVKLVSNEQMTIGYLTRKGNEISQIGKKYLEEISKYINKGMN